MIGDGHHTSNKGILIVGYMIYIYTPTIGLMTLFKITWPFFLSALVLVPDDDDYYYYCYYYYCYYYY